MARPALVAAPTHRREKPPAAPGSAPPTAERATLEDLFAAESPQPLADAFPGKRAVHPFIGMDPVPEGTVPRHWDEIYRSPRRNRGVAYIHVPFCENHCLFCGFYQNPWSASVGPPYVDAVIAQLESFARSPAHDGPPLQAVYLGGGTPTALASPDLARLVMAIRRCLPLVPDCEITLEGRVQSFDCDKALAAFDAGVNRISVGVQSFSERIRRPLGRRAGTAGVISLLESLVGLDRGAVVVDLIYGLPQQSPEDVAGDVRLCAQLGLDGLDLYSLSLIAGTPLLSAIEKGKLHPAAGSSLGTYFAAGEEAAMAEGWSAISTTHWQGSLRERNVYNLAVKTGADCLPFGAGAGGFLGGFNYRITADLRDFAARAGSGTCLTAAMMRATPAAPIHNALKSGMERGRLDTVAVDAALARVCGSEAASFSTHAAPLLAQWSRAGLLEPYHRFHRLTRAGRFWQVAMTGRLITWLRQHPDLGDRHGRPDS
ncbi:heme anaerobic degradation radical SAM methyltransferase ChuW/HutW [Paracoccus sp. SSJ]|uniref:heme anaerobic degradation radical SAM methyltransferase ChuW/HutW n=1 Tax=Paracoccus sp. SSJ TaxID=3050636 RepID=UPI00254E59D0|nr:heme anaerobic degradation radical SAM methyltransferase ChuW/HutW [Paracoccus sp. SSJ]MDK8873362.1 heme anaerobic degradation radical SAM methyltransferase ChuW/HutW [Paracoccus sp. SSJ]